MCQPTICTYLVLYIRTEVCNSLWRWTWMDYRGGPLGWPATVSKGDYRDLTTNTLIQYSTSVYICTNRCISQRHFIYCSLYKSWQFSTRIEPLAGKGHVLTSGSAASSLYSALHRAISRSCHAQNCLPRAEARCSTSRDAIYIKYIHTHTCIWSRAPPRGRPREGPPRRAPVHSGICISPPRCVCSFFADIVMLLVE